MRKIPSALLAVGFVLWCSNSIVHAISLDFIPASSHVMQGNPLSVALAISGLGDHAAPSLSAFDVEVTFNTSMLSFTNATFGDAVLGDQLNLAGSGSLTAANVTSPGALHVAEVSFDAQSDLETMQAGSFTLVTLTFDTIGQGGMTFGLTLNAFANSSGDALTDASGNPPIVTPGTGVITVTPSTAVPEPSASTLLGIGLASLLGYAWFRRQPKPSCISRRNFRGGTHLLVRWW